MCRQWSSELDLYLRTTARPGRSLLGWLRDLLRPRLPQAGDAEVVPLVAQAARTDEEADRRRAKAA